MQKSTYIHLFVTFLTAIGACSAHAQDSEDFILIVDDSTEDTSGNVIITDDSNFQDQIANDQGPHYGHTPVIAEEDLTPDPVEPTPKKPVIPPLTFENVTSYLGGGAKYYEVRDYTLKCYSRSGGPRFPLVVVTKKKSGENSSSYVSYDPQIKKFRFLTKSDILKSWWYKYAPGKPCELSLKLTSKTSGVSKKFKASLRIESARFPGNLNTKWEKIYIKPSSGAFISPFLNATIEFKPF